MSAEQTTLRPAVNGSEVVTWGRSESVYALWMQAKRYDRPDTRFCLLVTASVPAVLVILAAASFS